MPGVNRPQGDRLPQAARRASTASQSGIGRLKTEMLQSGCFLDAADARTELFASIDGSYNTPRRHSSLAYQTPASFEASLTN